MDAQIPGRSSSKYAGQYARAFDSQRIVEIFTDSHRIALSSKNPDTARDRFALAVEAYHQIMSMPASRNIRSSIQEAMANLVKAFPYQVVVNEALGLREKARKLKTPRKRLELLHRAAGALERGLEASPESTALQAAAGEVRAEIVETETNMT